MLINSLKLLKATKKNESRIYPIINTLYVLSQAR